MYPKTAEACAQDRAITINKRLNKTLGTLAYQCERIEAVLSRVNGTPQKIEAVTCGQTPQPTLSMQATIDGLDNAVTRLVELAGGVERIA